ncbi:hypothetical protein [Burkholderia ubonensis]|nr:hypothetical protein [Burkholderia ubonensis]
MGSVKNVVQDACDEPKLPARKMRLQGALAFSVIGLRWMEMAA